MKYLWIPCVFFGGMALAAGATSPNIEATAGFAALGSLLILASLVLRLRD